MLVQISLWENWNPIKKHKETVKTRMVNSTGNANKKLRKQASMIKKREALK